MLFEPFALDWSAFDEECFAHYQALIALRTRHEALRRGEVAFAPADADQVVQYWRRTSEEQICITVNLSDTGRTPQPHKTPLEWLYRHGAEADDRDSLAPYGVLIERIIGAR